MGIQDPSSIYLITTHLPRTLHSLAATFITLILSRFGSVFAKYETSQWLEYAVEHGILAADGGAVLLVLGLGVGLDGVLGG